ncbi:MAG TPA: helix-turn-helix transcriptional regulator [Acidimicrobiales bacterium]|nr:helix-turn-helix transcriptional regulator [Acidimicrobiales bacterium]
MAFGRRVRERRSALGWSQMKLAEECGLHFTYVSSVERGERNLSLANIVKIAWALRVDPGTLVARLVPPFVSSVDDELAVAEKEPPFRGKR